MQAFSLHPGELVLPPFPVASRRRLSLPLPLREYRMELVPKEESGHGEKGNDQKPRALMEAGGEHATVKETSYQQPWCLPRSR